MNYTLILIFLVACIIGLLVPILLRVVRLFRGPNELRSISSAVKVLGRTSSNPTIGATKLNAAVLATANSKYPLVRLTGSYLQNWQHSLTQESIYDNSSLLSKALDKMYTALSLGNKTELCRAWDQLLVISKGLQQDTSSLDKASGRENVVELLKQIARLVREGRREQWREHLNKLSSYIPQLDENVRPIIYLVAGFIERPIKYTEVPLERETNEEDTSKLSGLLEFIAEELVKSKIDTIRLINALGTYELSRTSAT